MSDSGTTAPSPAGKGRPTPKRSEKQRRRTGPVAPPPKTRKEASRRKKDEARASRQRIRQGSARGEERYLVKRDAGPVRKVVRDTVDRRRSAGTLLLPLAVGLILAQLSGNAVILEIALTLWLVGLLLVVLDAVLLVVRIRRAVRSQFPDEAGMVGHVLYGMLRATVFRRWRLPPATVKAGRAG